MSEAPENDENEFEDVPEDPEDPEEPGSPGMREVFLPPYMRRQAGAQTRAERPLTNQDAIPLLPNANKKTEREAVGIKVFKLDPPNSGFKGEVPLSADQAYIASQWGDGVYTLELFNDKRVTLKKVEGVKIACGYVPNAGSERASDSIESERLSATQENQREGRLDRIHREVLDRTTKLADKHTDLVMQSAERMSTREQSFFTSMIESARQSAAEERERSRQSHDQEMERIREQHRMDMERERERNAAMLQQNNPANALELLRQGIELAGGMGSGEPTEPWVKAVEHGVTGLKHLRDIAVVSRGRKLIRGGAKPRALTAGTRGSALANAANAGNGGGKAATGTAPTSVPSQTPRSQKTREIAREVALVARECDKRGIDFREVLRNAIGKVDATEPSDTGPGSEGVGP